MTELQNIRNFSIVAHIDHGKSTLADRLIQFCGGLSDREMKEQVLDSMVLERERGITIKAQTVKLNYKSKDGKDYILNITSDNVTLDCNYHTINGTVNRGIFVDDSDNVTVKNCNINLSGADSSYGIYYNNADEGTIKNNIAQII